MGRFSCDDAGISEHRGFFLKPLRIPKTGITSVIVTSMSRVTFDETVLTITDGVRRIVIGELDPDFDAVAEFVDHLPGVAKRWREIFSVMHPDLDPIEILTGHHSGR